jgi:hypothetical protein
MVDAPGADGGWDDDDKGGGDGPDLAAVAQAGLADTTGEGTGQQALDPALEFSTHFKVNGVSYRTNASDFKLGQKITLQVDGVVSEIGDQLMADGHDRHVVKVKADNVRLLGDDGEPVAP